MSMFGDYKLYKKHLPEYSEWKTFRDTQEAKRLEYLKQNPNNINPKDIQKGKALLRAIDAMDEYSQKNAENTEIITQQIMGQGTSFAMYAGGGIGGFLGSTKFFQNIASKFVKNPKNIKIFSIAAGAAIGGVLAMTLAAFPLNAWAAKAEVNSSRRGRFQAMRTELSNPNTFATLTPNQEDELQRIMNQTAIKKEKKENKFKGLKALKEMLFDSDDYLLQRMEFERKLEADNFLHDRELSAEEIEDAKRDQQILTKLVEKIDIASQDYAENAELATSAVTTFIFGFGALFTLAYNKIAEKLKWKSSMIPAILSGVAALGFSIFATQIQKEASRVGRFKVKQELIKNPQELVYVSDEKTSGIKDVEAKSQKKVGMLKFLFQAFKDQREYKKWKKTEGKLEKSLANAMEQIELTDEQKKDAIRLQHNTFKTFNKVDENSQKYSESIEALGQSIQTPLTLICSMLGVAFGLKHLKKENAMGMVKYVATIILSTIPAILTNAYITKEQKKASRVADMISINEMSDYKNFADYSRFY